MDTKDLYIQRLKALHQTKSKNDISDAEALELFERLITLVSVVYKPIQQDEKD